ncbi:RNA polymerase sigma-70 factor [Muricauda ruestringensis]|uniref:RNA polymerase sigma-70 factor n=1 Tax=Flagellimonas aurea TaxID=2915619 RepID=A0ABS3G8K3_9FLAO|nr:RNA polymerase sigma-70 factor [Allomuricauda aurea]MBO0355756.1 RNA polymerase sigma-70 factor [Allomuricauda aurea]
MLPYALHDMNATDTHLLLLSKADNQIAFKQLYDRHWKRLYLFALKLLKEKAEAKDAVQDVFSNLWTKRKELDIKHPEAYLMASIKYKCLEYLKEKKLSSSFLQQFELPTQGNPIENKIHFEETMELLDTGIDGLPAKTKKIFKMSRHEDLSNKEIAYLLNISTKTVEYHITQSIKQLREVIVT